jgi:negative regulator of flagellin synthesis FlgM
MKIQPPSIDALRGKEAAAPGERPAAKGAAPSAPGAGSDRVDLSPLAGQIAALESSLVAEPGFDRARVEAIKQAIVEGRLTVDSATVADRMIASALAMMKRDAA